jgi:hypothetical protein
MRMLLSVCLSVRHVFSRYTWKHLRSRIYSCNTWKLLADTNNASQYWLHTLNLNIVEHATTSQLWPLYAYIWYCFDNALRASQLIMLKQKLLTVSLLMKHKSNKITLILLLSWSKVRSNYYLLCVSCEARVGFIETPEWNMEAKSIRFFPLI